MPPTEEQNRKIDSLLARKELYPSGVELLRSLGGSPAEARLAAQIASTLRRDHWEGLAPALRQPFYADCLVLQLSAVHRLRTAAPEAPDLFPWVQRAHRAIITHDPTNAIGTTLLRNEQRRTLRQLDRLEARAGGNVELYYAALAARHFVRSARTALQSRPQWTPLFFLYAVPQFLSRRTVYESPAYYPQREHLIGLRRGTRSHLPLKLTEADR